MIVSIPETDCASEETVASLVERYGNLPIEYIDFLKIHDGAKMPSNVLEGTNCEISIDGFLNSYDIIKKAESIDGLSSDLLPFGEDESGNFICLGVKDHRIYFWDHEIDIERVVAQSFGEFIERLEPFDNSFVNLDRNQVTRVWVDPNFKPEF